jgi:hypothetical protein
MDAAEPQHPLTAGEETKYREDGSKSLLLLFEGGQIYLKWRMFSVNILNFSVNFKALG